MDSEDAFPLFIALIIGGSTWGHWYYASARVFAPNSSPPLRMAVAVAPVLSIVVVFLALQSVAEPKVANSGSYQLLFAATAAISLRALFVLLRWFDLDPMNGAIASANTANAFVVLGTIIANTTLNLGANVGTGDTIASVFVPVAFGVIELGAFLFAVISVTSLAEETTSGRNLCAGCRLGGLIVASALPLSRAAMGDWISTEATIIDMTGGAWPLPLLVALAVAVERRWPADDTRGTAAACVAGLIPAVLYIAVSGAAAWFLRLGP